MRACPELGYSNATFWIKDQIHVFSVTYCGLNNAFVTIVVFGLSGEYSGDGCHLNRKGRNSMRLMWKQLFAESWLPADRIIDMNWSWMAGTVTPIDMNKLHLCYWKISGVGCLISNLLQIQPNTTYWHWQKCKMPLITRPRSQASLAIISSGQIHYNDVIMSAKASQVTSTTVVYSTVHSVADQRKHQSSVSLVIVRGIRRWPVNSPHKETVMRKMLPFDDGILSALDRNVPQVVFWYWSLMNCQNGHLSPRKMIIWYG